MAGFKDMKPEQKLLAISLVSGILAAAAAFFLITMKENSINEAAKPVRIIVASKYVAAWAVIDREAVEYGEIPGKYLTEAHVTDFQKLKGRVALVPFIKGEPILLNKVAEKEAELNTAIPGGMRAVAVSVDEETGVGYMIKPGDCVDVLLTFDSSGGKGAYNMTATILQAARVIATGRNFSSISEDVGYRSITLALTPEEAEVFIFAKEKGRISFSLRPVGDTVREKIATASFPDILRQARETEKINTAEENRDENSIRKREE